MAVLTGGNCFSRPSWPKFRFSLDRRELLLPALLAEAPGQGEEDGGGGQQHHEHVPHEPVVDEQRDPGPQHGPQHRPGGGKEGHEPADAAALPVPVHADGGAHGHAHLVGAQRKMGGQPRQQERRQADGPAAAGDGVAHPCQEQQRAHDQQLFYKFGHSSPPIQKIHPVAQAVNGGPSDGALWSIFSFHETFEGNAPPGGRKIDKKHKNLQKRG